MDLHSVRNTKVLRDTIGAHEETSRLGGCGPGLPPLFCKSIREAIDAGLSCNEIIAFVNVAASLFEARELFTPEEIAQRAHRVASVIRGDNLRKRAQRKLPQDVKGDDDDEIDSEEIFAIEDGP